MIASLRLAVRQIVSAPLRSLLAALAVASGVATLVASEIISLSVTAEINRTAEFEAITGFMSEQMNTGLTAISLVITAAAGFLLLNSISMSVAQRSADLGRLRAVGMTRCQMAGMILVEAAILGLVGSTLGIAIGLGVGRGLIYLLEATSDILINLGRQTYRAHDFCWLQAWDWELACAPPWHQPGGLPGWRLRMHCARRPLQG